MYVNNIAIYKPRSDMNMVNNIVNIRSGFIYGYLMLFEYKIHGYYMVTIWLFVI